MMAMEMKCNDLRYLPADPLLCHHPVFVSSTLTKPGLVLLLLWAMLPPSSLTTVFLLPDQYTS